MGGAAEQAQHESDDGLSDSAVVCILVAACLAVATVLFFVNRRFYEDDALITLRYCRNLLEGHGLVWNIGERVEGYTNFLYLMAVAGLGRLGLDLVVASRVVSIGAYIGIALLIVGYTVPDWQPGQRARGVVPLIVTMTSCPIVVWALGGLESTLCALLALAAVVLLARVPSTGSPTRIAAAGVLFALATMTRMDAILFVPPALAHVIFGVRTPKRLPRAVLLGAVFVGVYVPYFVWRMHYYGAPYPNTFYVKATGRSVRTFVEGMRYAAAVLLKPPGLALWLLAATAVAIRRRAVGPRLVYVATTALAYMAFPVFAGGDHMPAGRFIVPVLPVVALLLYEAIVAANWADTPVRTLAIGSALLAGALLQLPFARLNPVRADPAAFIGKIVGQYVAAHWPVRSLVSLEAAGAVPYYAKDLRFIDMLGLTDRHIAHQPIIDLGLPLAKYPGHQKGDGAYVLARAPDFIILGPVEGTSVETPMYTSDYEINQRRDAFERDYRKEEVNIDIRDIPGREAYSSTASGNLHFIYYRRIAVPNQEWAFGRR